LEHCLQWLKTIREKNTENVVRVQCRKRLREELLSSQVSKRKGKQLFPHDAANVFQRTATAVIVTKWNDIRDNVKEAISKVRQAERSR
jgi:hypothetical protein